MASRLDACIFCQIAQGQTQFFKVWEDSQHLAFLSIFPNTPGVTVVIPKVHCDSYLREISPAVYHPLMDAAIQVASLLDQGFSDVIRTAFVFEGLGVNHLHVKLFPLHGMQSDRVAPAAGVLAPPPNSGGGLAVKASEVKTFSTRYEGFISTHDGPLASVEDLNGVLQKIHTGAGK